MNLPIRVRLTLWYAALFTITIAALSTFLVLQLRADLRDALDQDARASTEELTRVVLELGEEDPADANDEDEDDTSAEEARDFAEEARAILAPSGAAAQLMDPEGQVISSYGAVAEGPPLVGAGLVQRAQAGAPVTLTRSVGSGEQHYLLRVTAVESQGDVHVLVLAENLQPVESAVGRVIALLLVAGPAALALTSLAAYWLARKAMQPVERMTSDADEIGIDRLHERVAVPSVSDETRRLAVTLNAMLDRIERGVAEKHRLIADASHELRTPLAVMRTELDVSLRRDELSAPAREVLDSVRDEVNRMAHTVDNLLTLAQADEGRLELLTVPVDLRALADETVTSLAAMAEVKSIRLLVDGDRADCLADPQRIRLALTNLLENAIDFSPAGGDVRVTCWQREGEVGITVTDQGPGVAPEDREHVFDRFYRVDTARGRDLGGSGLGLAICRELAQAHGGRVWVESEPGSGSAFSLALPAWRTSPPAEAVPATVS